MFMKRIVGSELKLDKDVFFFDVIKKTLESCKRVTKTFFIAISSDKLQTLLPMIDNRKSSIFPGYTSVGGHLW